jgi:hypothetical protein
MAAYDPTDPFNWKGIAAELADQAAGLNPDGSTRYTLPSMGMDPEYIAYLAQYDNNVVQANADSELRRRRAQDDYTEALRVLEQQGLTGARDVDTSMLARGMFNSGETMRRQQELGQRIAQGRDQADVSLANARGTIDADQQKALTALTLERESQIVASKARVAGAQREGAEAAGFLKPAAASTGTPAAATSTQTPRPATSTSPSAPRTAPPANTGPGYRTGAPAAPGVNGPAPVSYPSRAGAVAATGIGRPTPAKPPTRYAPMRYS